MGQRPRYGKGWIKTDAGWKSRLEVDGGAVLRREVGQESHNAAGARGNFGWHAPPTKQLLHVFAKEAGGHQHGPDGVWAASASASSFVVHHTQQISMAAVAGDAEKQTSTSRRALCAPTGSRTSKRQTASCPRPQWGVPAPPSSADGPLHPSRTDHVVPTIAVVGSLVM